MTYPLRDSGTNPLVFVTVGTDHHPFHRLVQWVDEWLDSPAGRRVRCLLQTGTSEAPHHGGHRPYLSYSQVEAAVAEAAAVVCHGGPGSVMLCRWLGKKPIVVPRRRDRGEHVDDHQVLFARTMAAEGQIELAEDRAALRRLLDEIAEGTLDLELTPSTNGAAETIERFQYLMDTLLDRRRHGRRGWASSTRSRQQR